MPIRLVRAIVAAVALVAAGSAVRAQDAAITVFAAASLKNALDAVNAAYAGHGGGRAVASYAATSALVRQIEQGAPADVFASADLAWMDYALQRGLVDAATRTDLLGNRLVLVAPRDSRIGPVTLGPGFDLAGLAGDRRIVTGDMKAVPVGRYTLAALRNLGLWESVKGKIAMVENVRAALALVARREAALGIVYETDAGVEPGVVVIARFPADSHPPIVYPVAATANAKAAASRYLGHLRSAPAKAAFEAHGFIYLAKPTL